MKKVTFFLVIILVTSTISCSKDNDNSNKSNNFINPPDWIIGTWLDESEPTFSQIGGFQFTDDNLISISANGDVIIDLKEGLREGVDVGVIKTNEVITNSNYELEIITSGTVTNSYKFTRDIDASSIIYDLSVTYDVLLAKQ